MIPPTIDDRLPLQDPQTSVTDDVTTHEHILDDVTEIVHFGGDVTPHMSPNYVVGTSPYTNLLGFPGGPGRQRASESIREHQRACESTNEPINAGVLR